MKLKNKNRWKFCDRFNTKEAFHPIRRNRTEGHLGLGFGREVPAARSFLLPLPRRLQASERRSAARSRTKNQSRQEGREKRVDGEKKGRENFFISSGGFFVVGGFICTLLAVLRYAYAGYVLLSWPRPAGGTRVQCQRGLLGSPPCDLTSSATAPAGLPAVYVRVGPTCKRVRGYRRRDQSTVLPLGPTDCAC